MASVSTAQQAPGPPGYPLIGNLLEFRRDVLGALLNSRRTYGDIVRFRLGPTVVHLVAHPDHIQQVLVTQQQNYDKDTRSSAKIRCVTGDGLLTSNGPFWRQQRRLMQPIFSPQRVASFFGIMTEATTAMRDRWTHRSAPTLDVASEMMRLTCTIVAQALFGTDVTPDLEAIEQSATVLMEHAWHRLERLIDVPMFVPTPGNWRYRTALSQLDKIVQRIIARRQLFAQSDDLLTMLLRGKDAESGQSMSEVHVRNETITLLLSGHETTANSLTWTWYLLSQHPVVAQRARAEIAAVVGSRLPTLDDLPRLVYLTQVYRESLRLYPPIWIMERRAREDNTIGGCHIPAGSAVVVSPFVTHRHPDFWDNPDAFDPDRFRPEQTVRRTPLAYLPFGAGQRLCIGSHFAMMEALVILAMILQRFQLDLVPGHPVEPRPGITLCARHGLLMTVRDAER